MKPASSVVSIGNDVIRPDPALYGDTHYEAELCIQLSADLSNATMEQAKQAIGGVTLGLDLTLRDLQTQLKDKGQPWERAKCFDGACVLADWIDPQAYGDLSQVQYQLMINDELKQDGDSALMLFPVYELLVEISHAFSLQAGDVIMTGTPSGVGILHAGDQLKLVLARMNGRRRYSKQAELMSQHKNPKLRLGIFCLISHLYHKAFTAKKSCLKNPCHQTVIYFSTNCHKCSVNSGMFTI